MPMSDYTFGKEYQKDWFVSPYNFRGDAGNKNFPDHVELYDCTLREGEQHNLGISFTKDQKLDIAHKLIKARFPFVEIALVAASQDDRDVITQLNNEDLTHTTITGICRMKKEDIDMAANCGLKYIVITCMTAETVLLAHKGWTVDTVAEMLLDTLKYAQSKGCFEHIAISLPDSAKQPTERFVRMGKLAAPYVQEMIAMDTFSDLSPFGAATMFEIIQPQIAPLQLTMHCHNDFGYGAACALGAASAGCKRLHASFLGIGEKTGNAPMEQTILGLEMLCGVDTGIDMTMIPEIAETVSKYTGIKIATNTPVVGPGPFASVSPTATADAVRLLNSEENWDKWGKWNNPFLPRAIGKPNELNVVMCKSVGSVHVKWFLDKWGVTLDDDQIRVLVNEAKALSIDKSSRSVGGRVSEEELKEIAIRCGFIQK